MSDDVKEVGAIIYRAQTVRMYPTPTQEARLTQWVGAVRFVYNLALEQRRDWWRQGRRFNFITQGREITALRAAVDWISDVPREPLDAALRDLDAAHRNWWAGRARAPSPRKRGLNDTMRFPSPDDFAISRVSRRGGVLKVPKLGQVPVRLDRGLVGRPLNMTISRRAGRWFASIQCEVQCESLPAAGAPIGIDRGIRVFAALSNGMMIEGPHVGRKAATSLARAQRNLSRKVKGSNNRRKARLKVARLHMRVANARKDFLHRISTTIAKNHSVVVLENLKVGNMTRKRVGRGRAAKAGLNREILDQGWGLFRQMLAYKLAERGGELVLVPANDTSRTCAACGVIDKASRSGARFSCTACGHEDDADLNAAINILRRGRASVLPVEGSPSWAPDEAGTSGRAA